MIHFENWCLLHVAPRLGKREDRGETDAKKRVAKEREDIERQVKSVVYALVSP